MAKPFKSEFDLMAEAYGTISYKNQRLINEDKAGRRVIGYPPQQGQLINESVNGEVLAACKQRAVELGGPQAVTTKAGMAVGCKSIYDEYSEGGDKEKAEIAFSLHHHFDEQAKGGFERTVYKAGEVGVEDGESYDDPHQAALAEPAVKAAGPTLASTQAARAEPIVRGSGSFEDRNLNQHELAMAKAKGGIEDAEGTEDKVDYGPSGEGKPVHPDEAAESVPGMNSRIDGMIDRDALGAAQAALQNILADLHANGEEFEADDVAAFIASTLS